MATDSERDADGRLAEKQERYTDEVMESQVTQHRVQRPNDVALLFHGELLADVSSRDDEPGKQRWQTIRLWRSIAGRYVAEEIGHSSILGEKDFVKVVILDQPSEVREFFYKVGRHGRYLTDLAVEAMEMAAGVDPDMQDALTEAV